MKKSGITSPSERRSPCREPAGNSAHSLKLTFVSNFLKERRTSILWLQKTAFFPIFCEIGKKIFWKSAPKLSFLKHVNGGLIFVNSPILKFVNGAQKPHLRCADSLPTIRFPAVYLPFLKNQWKITWISRSVCE